ncbi:MAG: hypothetical protein ALECFALPRED_005078 [Alectoria fallacina]|uniref:Uncharacterized protein n=1 Tax=Alectoria fallacina TaxID=1903189 RepID=A0A8H3IXZ5_9LECA|nr:MAG: hypothetical protein ALECFALPRED_005078 [Alectoria fallacina]
MAPHTPDIHAEKPGHSVAENVQLADDSYDTVKKPFHQTHLGKLPPELRQMIYTGLLATPPSYAGHDFASNFPEHKISPSASEKCVHIMASWSQVTQTCRQIYMESRPVFFASKSYYLANPLELTYLIGHDNISSRPFFLWDTITALCLRDLVKHSKVYTKEQVDNIFSDPTDYRRFLNTRQEIEAMTVKTLDTSLGFLFRRLNSLRTVGLCLRVGEEMLYVNFLYCLSGMRRGLVEFVDPGHWLMRPQNPEDVWKLQYACFTCGDFANGKDDEHISYDERCIELDVTDIDSRAPGLQEGEERYVKVQLQFPAKSHPLQDTIDEDESEMDWQTVSDYSNVESSSEDSDQAQLERPQDQIEDESLAEASEDDHTLAELERVLRRTVESSLVGPKSENGRDPQSDQDTDQEDGALLGPASKEVYGTQPETQSDHVAGDPLSSRSLPSVIQNAPTYTENDRMFLIDTHDEEDQVQPKSKLAIRRLRRANLQHSTESLAESALEANQFQDGLRDKAEEKGRSTSIQYLSSQSKQPLLDVSDTPNPYTDEEMESYEKWQQLAIAGNQEQAVRGSYPGKKFFPSFGRTRKHHVKHSCVPSKTPTPKEKSSPSLPSQSGLSSKPVQMGGLFLLVLLIVITSLPPKWSNARQDGERQ